MTSATVLSSVPSAAVRRELAHIARNYPRRLPLMLETQVRNGFPVIVMGSVFPKDASVGIFWDSVEDVTVVSRDWKSVDFLKLTRAEMAGLEKELAKLLKKAA